MEMVSTRENFFLIILCLTLRWSPCNAELPLPIANEESEQINFTFDGPFELRYFGCDFSPIPPSIDSSELHFILQTHCNNDSYGINHFEELFQNERFIETKPTDFIVTGWLNTETKSNARYTIASALLCRDTSNIIYLDVGNHLNTLIYPKAVQCLKGIGKIVAKAFAKVYFKHKLFFETINLICHSLGAHLCGFIGRYFTRLTGGVKLPLINSLDAAKPCFADGVLGAVVGIDGIKATDAVTVIATHTNPGQYGLQYPYGTIDYYSGYLSSIQKGCPTINPGCSHSRAFEIYAESICIGSEYNFIAKKCHNMRQLANEKCNGNKNYYGYKDPHTTTGIHAFKTKKNEPYGLGATIKSSNCYHLSCRLCQ